MYLYSTCFLSIDSSHKDSPRVLNKQQNFYSQNQFAIKKHGEATFPASIGADAQLIKHKNQTWKEEIFRLAFFPANAQLTNHNTKGTKEWIPEGLALYLTIHSSFCRSVSVPSYWAETDYSFDNTTTFSYKEFILFVLPDSARHYRFLCWFASPVVSVPLQFPPQPARAHILTACEQDQHSACAP